MKPDDFDLGGGDDPSPDAPLADDAWDLSVVGIPRLVVHPRHILGDDDLAVLELWQLWRGQGGAVVGMGVAARLPGVGHLPFSGGAAEQPSCLMASFAIMDQAAVAIERG